MVGFQHQHPFALLSSLGIFPIPSSTASTDIENFFQVLQWVGLLDMDIYIGQVQGTLLHLYLKLLSSAMCKTRILKALLQMAWHRLHLGSVLM
jgi:hypothetical protein